jgi:hypothetical protein
LRAPNAVAISTFGLTAGLVPPAAGCEWHPTQLSRLKRGPSPLPTPSASENASSPLAKKRLLRCREAGQHCADARGAAANARIARDELSRRGAREDDQCHDQRRQHRHARSHACLLRPRSITAGGRRDDGNVGARPFSLVDSVLCARHPARSTSAIARA